MQRYLKFLSNWHAAARVLNFRRLKIPKRKLSCAERTTFCSPDSGQGTENLQDGSNLKLNALDNNKGIVKYTFRNIRYVWHDMTSAQYQLNIIEAST